MCLSVDLETDRSLLTFWANVLLQLQKHILLTFDQGWLHLIMESSICVFKNAVEVGYADLHFIVVACLLKKPILLKRFFA